MILLGKQAQRNLGRTIMTLTRPHARHGRLMAVVGAAIIATAGSAAAQGKSGVFEGTSVRIGHGTAHTVVRADKSGKIASVSVVFTPGMLEGLPQATKGGDPDFPYLLPMPKRGPKTVFDHVVINWESEGHPPSHVYDVPHFDFHFYLVSYATQLKVAFKDDKESGDPSQRPAAELMPVGYILPPGTAVSKMGVHAVNPGAQEFHKQPFTATFIYGYYNKEQTFIEPMASLAFLKSKPTFSSPISRPASFSKQGLYPSAYGVKYDGGRKVYEVALTEFK